MQDHARKLGVVLALMVVAVLLAAVGAVVLTDAGQIIGISKSVVIGYFRVHEWIMGLAVLAAGAALLLNRRWGLLRRRWMVTFVVVVVGCLFATKFATPYILFPSKQHGTEYRAVGELDGYLEPTDRVYAVEHLSLIHI